MNPSNLSPGQFNMTPNPDTGQLFEAAPVFGPQNRPASQASSVSQERRTPTAEEALASGQLSLSLPAKTVRGFNPLPGDRLRRTPDQDWVDYGSGFVDHMEANDGYNDPGFFGTPGRREDTEEMWDRKLDESQDNGLYDAIYDGGVKKPVHVYHGEVSGTTMPGVPVIAQGHHRVAAAADIDPRMEVPVRHFDPDYGEIRDATVAYNFGNSNVDSRKVSRRKKAPRK